MQFDYLLINSELEIPMRYAIDKRLLR